jgi:hypothetical protein
MMENKMDLFENPMGTDGFEFVEYTAPDTKALGRLFEQMGFVAVAKHRSKNVLLYKQGDIQFIVNAEPDSFAQSFARVHGPSACAFGIRVKDAAYAFKRAVELGAKPYDGPVGPMELNIPALQGIGGSLLYLIDRYGTRTIYDVDFLPLPGVDQNPVGVGLDYVDHLTHNVYIGRMDTWATGPVVLARPFVSAGGCSADGSANGSCLGKRFDRAVGRSCLLEERALEMCAQRVVRAGGEKALEAAARPRPLAESGGRLLSGLGQ